MLPDDPAVLKALVVQLLEELQKTQARLERQEHHMHLLLTRLYGSTSEKTDPRQGVLFTAEAGEEEAVAVPPASPSTTDASSASSPTSRNQNRDRHGRGRIPDEIQREEHVHDLTEAEMAAMGGAGNLVELPPERSEQLDWRPSKLFVVVHVRKKYARKTPLPESGLTLAEQNVAVARKPPEAIPGGLPGPGLLAQVIVSKYGDHLPLHRLEGIFERQGMRISRQTSDGWVLACAELCVPLHRLMIEVVLGSLALHTDDTPVKVRDAWRKLKYTGRFWTYVGDKRHPLTVFEYTTSRKRDGPAEFLKNYRGYLQADAFGGYDGIYTGSDGRIVEAGLLGACAAKISRKSSPRLAADGNRLGMDQATLRCGEGTSPTAREPVASVVAGGTSDAGCRPAAGALPAPAGRIPCLAGVGIAEDLAQERGASGDGLHPLELGRALSLHRVGLVGHRQQRRRELPAGHLSRTQELAFLWK